MIHRRIPDHFLLYFYYTFIILIGTVLLSQDFSAAAGAVKPSLVDAFFTAVSASCVTGLATVDAQSWSLAGQWIILFLIQAGGLGIASFAMLYLVLPGFRISIREKRMLGDMTVAGNIVHGREIIRGIWLTTLLIEALGAVFLYYGFSRSGAHRPIFSAVFHAVSAFCNAGFSIYSDGVSSFDFPVLFPLILLIVFGGLGFSVISDLSGSLLSGVSRIIPGSRGSKLASLLFRRRVEGFDWRRRRGLSFYSRLMLSGTLFFLLLGALGYLALDWNNLFEPGAETEAMIRGGRKSADSKAGFFSGRRLLAVLFQSVSTRTAGFSTIDQKSLSLGASLLTIFLMLAGGGSGSTAGGLKVSTSVVLLLIFFRSVNEDGDVNVIGRKVSARVVSRTAMFFVKAMFLLGLSWLFLSIVERPNLSGFTPLEIVFESTSAFATAGLSMGITARLSVWGKIIIAATMFAGRVGLFSLIIRQGDRREDNLIELPRGDVLIG